MNLERVTITGADDSTDIQELVALSAEFPFVEWAILVSKKQEGSYRFPGRKWIDEFSIDAHGAHCQVAMHLCGAWVRQLLTGTLDWCEVPDVIDVSARVQINTHAEPHESRTAMAANLKQQSHKQFIFQWDGVNDHLAYAMQPYGLNVAALFDTSGGAGRLPGSWPEPTPIPCGYAGGLSPDNVVEQVAIIEKLCPKPYWIDMERRVRTDDDSALDMARVRRVLELCKPLVVYQ